MPLNEHWELMKHFAKEDMAQVMKSFADAYTQGHHAELAFKSAGVVAGAVLTAKGVQQFVKGVSERVPGAQDPNTTQPNYTRMFVGSFSAFFGAAALYLSACKGILPARSL